jgi:hypothetical protein
MPERQPPRVTLDTEIGPDVDLDAEDIRLVDGTRLTPDLAEQIAEEMRRSAGRPSLTGSGKHSPEVSARVPPELLDSVKQEARRAGVSVSRVIREALEWYFDYLAHGGPSGLSGSSPRRVVRRRQERR